MQEKKRFDEAASTWDETTAHTERAQRMAELILPLIHQYHLRTALDYGAGTGYLSFLLQEHLDGLTLMDSSDGMLGEAQKKIAQKGLKGKIRTNQADLLKDHYPEKHDLIYILMTLHHIRDTEAILQAFYDHLNEGGFLCIGDLDEEDGSFHSEFPEFDGHNGFNQVALKTMMERTGFKQVQSTFFYHLEKETEGGTRNYPMFFMSGRK